MGTGSRLSKSLADGAEIKHCIRDAAAARVVLLQSHENQKLEYQGGLQNVAAFDFAKFLPSSCPFLRTPAVLDS